MRKFLAIFSLIALIAIPVSAEVTEVSLSVDVASGETSGTADLTTGGLVRAVYTDFPASMTSTAASIEILNANDQIVGTVGSIGVTDGVDYPTTPIPVAASFWGNSWSVQLSVGTAEASTRECTVKVYIER